MRKIRDIRGEKFARLLALEATDNRSDCNNSVVWKCKCDCGEICFVSLCDLISSNVKSCGCLKSESSRKNAENSIKKNIVENTNISRIGSSKKLSNNTSGCTGVFWEDKHRRWHAKINFKKKSYFLGRYRKKEDAIAARRKAEREMFEQFLKEIKEDNNE